MTGIGSLVLDEVRESERAVRLLDLFSAPKVARGRDVFRVVSNDGVMWEMELVGGWSRDEDRLIEFERPPKHKIRIYGEPHYRKTREAAFGDGTHVTLYEMSMRYCDVDARTVLKECGVYNLSKLEEDVRVERFIEAYDRAKTETRRRWFVHAPVGGQTKVEQRATAVMGETLFDDVVVAMGEVGKEPNLTMLWDLGGSPVAREVRRLTRGVAACTYWTDAMCAEFAGVLRDADPGILESVQRGDKAAFDDLVYQCRVGGEVDRKVREFIESRTYPR